MNLAVGDTIQHNARRARIMSLHNGRVVVEWSDGTIQTGHIKALWMCNHIACAVRSNKL